MAYQLKLARFGIGSRPLLRGWNSMELSCRFAICHRLLCLYRPELSCNRCLTLIVLMLIMSSCAAARHHSHTCWYIIHSICVKLLQLPVDQILKVRKIIYLTGLFWSQLVVFCSEMFISLLAGLEYDRESGWLEEACPEVPSLCKHCRTDHYDITII